MNEEEDALVKSRQYGIPYASLENKRLRADKGQSLEKIIRENFARENLVFPLFLEHGVLAIAIVDPDDVLLLDSLIQSTGCQIQPFITTKTQILAVVDEFYGGESGAGAGVRL